MANVLFENPDCVKHAPPPVFAVNVLETFGENEIPVDVADDDMEDFRINHLEKVWRQVAVDAVTVHPKKDTEINIMFPMAAEILLPQWDWFQTRPLTGH